MDGTAILENGFLFNDYAFEKDISDIITESELFDFDKYVAEKGPIVKGNIVQSMVNIAKTIWGWIVNKFREIMSWFAQFSRKKAKNSNDKTLDDIAAYVLGESDVPSSKHLRFSNDKGGTIKFNYVFASVNGAPKHGIEGHDKDERPEQRLMVFGFGVIKHPELLDDIINILEDIKANNGVVDVSIKKGEEALARIKRESVNILDMTMTLEEMTTINDKIVKLMRGLELYDDHMMNQIQLKTNQGDEVSNKVIAFINKVADLGKSLQKVINAIGDGMREIYYLDRKYHDMINADNFREKLPLFVKTCVETNIPSKYVCYAIRAACDKSINCNPGNPSEKADINKAQSGNGRFVMIPGDPSLSKYVIKIGYNGLGSRSNRNEFMVWEKVKNIPEIARELYWIEDINDKDNYVILCQRAKPINQYKGTEKWNEKMRKLSLDNKIGFIIRCNDGGFGELEDGRVVCVDYGTVKRVS